MSSHRGPHKETLSRLHGRLLAALAMVFACLPVHAMTITHTTISSVTPVEPSGITLDAWVFAPDSPPAQALPAVVMMHGCAGVYSNSDAIGGVLASEFPTWGKRLVDAGYWVILVDSFTPRYVAENIANGVDPNTGLDGRNECGNSTGGISEVNQRSYDSQNAYAYITGATFAAQFGLLDANRVVLLGWSHGGSSVLASLDSTLHADGAAAQRFKAGVAFYPGCGLGGALPDYAPYAPLLILAAATDPLYTSGNCDQRLATAKSLPGFTTFFDMVVFKDAGHSFDIGGQSGTAEGNARARAYGASRAMEFLGFFGLGTGSLTDSVLAPGSYLYSTVPFSPMLPPEPVAAATPISVTPSAVNLDIAPFYTSALPQYTGALGFAVAGLPEGLSLSGSTLTGKLPTGGASFVVEVSNSDGILIQEMDVSATGEVSPGAGLILPTSLLGQTPASTSGTVISMDVMLTDYAQALPGTSVTFGLGSPVPGFSITSGLLQGSLDISKLPLTLSMVITFGSNKVTLPLKLAVPGDGSATLAVQWSGAPVINGGSNGGSGGGSGGGSSGGPGGGGSGGTGSGGSGSGPATGGGGGAIGPLVLLLLAFGMRLRRV